MSRELPSAVATALSGKTLYPVIFLKADFPSGAVRVCSHRFDVTAYGETYTGLGTLGTISDVDDAIDDSANEAQFTLGGSPAGIALALNENPRGVPVVSMIGFLDATTGLLIDEPTIDFAGFGSHFQLKPGAEVSSVTLICYDETGDQERTLEQRYTDAEQKRLHPGDKGLEYVADLPNKQFTWGNARVFTAQTPGPTDENPPVTDIP